MSESIVLDNSSLLKGLVPPLPTSPTARVTVVDSALATMHSPTSSTGSASVLEWNSNSDSELFNLSSPASAPAHADGSSLFSSSPFSTTPSLVGSLGTPAGASDERYRMYWPEMGYDKRPVPVVGAGATASVITRFSTSAPTSPGAKPTSDTSPTSAIAADPSMPAPHEHPAELNALIERMFLHTADVHGAVGQWMSAEALAAPGTPAADRAVVASEDEDEAVPEPESMPELLDMSITEDSSMMTVVPNAAAVAGTPAVAMSFFDPPSPPQSASVGASIISIAEYFKRRADERRPPLIDVEFSDGRSENNYDHAQSRAMNGHIATRDRKQEEIDEEESHLAATPRSAVSFFSPRAASPSSRVASSAASPYSARSPYNPPRMNMETYTSTIPSDAPGIARYGPSPSPSSAIRSSPAPSFVSNNTTASNNSVSASAARPLHEPLDVYSPSSSPSPSPPTGRAGPSAGAGNSFGPGSVPPVLGAAEMGNASKALPMAGAHTQRYAYPPVLPTWLPHPPALEFRNALKAAGAVPSPSLPSPPSPYSPTLTSTLPAPAPPLVSGLDAFKRNTNEEKHPLDLPSIRTWLSQQYRPGTSVHPPLASLRSAPSATQAFAQAAASVVIPPPPPPAPAGNGGAGATTTAGATATRRPRPPLPALPMSAPMSIPSFVPTSMLRGKEQQHTPQFAALRELPLPMGVGPGAGSGTDVQPPPQHTPFVSYAQALPSTWTGPAARVASPSLPASSDASSPPPIRVRAANAYANANTTTATTNASAGKFCGWGPGKPSAPSAYMYPHAYHSPPAPAMPLREARWWGAGPPEDSDTVSASDDVPPIPPPAPMRGGSFIPPPLSPSSPAFAPRGTATPPVPQFHPYGAYIASTPWGGGPSPRERERERRLRFASPPRSWYAPPPPPVPVPALSPPFYAPPVPPVRPSPGMAPGMGLGTPGMGMGATPVPWYMQSSPAPVIPPAGPPSAGWYTPVAKYAFADATVVFRVETFLFKVHRYFFERHSDYFVRLLSAYVFGDMSHVFLPGVKKADFECLLSVFYPENLTTPDITSLAGWTAVLSLSQRWEMAQPRALALSQIGTLASPMEKIALAHTHSITPAPAWLLPAYKAVCEAGAPPARHEVEGLDAGIVWGIWEVQHALAQGGRGREVYEEREKRVEQLVRARFGPFEGTPPIAGAGSAFVF